MGFIEFPRPLLNSKEGIGTTVVIKLPGSREEEG